MNLSEIVKTGIEKKPIKMVLHGPPGIGKSTFGSNAPDPIFLVTEDGLANIDVPRFPIAKTVNEVWQYLKMLIEEEHEYKTFVLDSLDWLERIFWADICEKHSVSSIDEIGYGKGYLFTMTHWDRFYRGLEKLREKNMAIILIAHNEIKTFSPPDGNSYDRYQIKLHKTAAAKAEEWSDAVLFANFKVFVNVEKGKTKGKAVGRERILFTQPNPAYRAKNRYNLPEEIPFSFDDFKNALNQTKGENN